MSSVAGFGPWHFYVLSLGPAPVNLESTFTVRRHVTWAIHLISHKGGSHFSVTPCTLGSCRLQDRAPLLPLSEHASHVSLNGTDAQRLPQLSFYGLLFLSAE